MRAYEKYSSVFVHINQVTEYTLLFTINLFSVNIKTDFTELNVKGNTVGCLKSK